MAGGDMPGDPVRALRATDPLAQSLFERHDLADGQVALRSLFHDGYLAAGPDGLLRLEAVLLDPPSPARHGFRLEPQPAGGTVLRHRGVAVGEPAARVEDIASTGPIPFQIVAASIEPGDHADCSGVEGHGPPHERRVQWNDDNHQYLVKAAFANLERLYAGSSDTAIKRLRDLGRDSVFMAGVARGLLAADYDSPYSDWLWASHFYHARTRRNWLGQTHPTAFTEALHYAAVATTLLETGGSSMRDKAAFNLGVALHYVTDMSQPMHVANMINGPRHLIGDVYTIDLRHKNFEILADELSKDYHGAANLVAESDVSLSGKFPPLLSDMLQALALASYDNFTKYVAPAMRAVPAVAWFTHKFTKAEVNTALLESLILGHQATAAFLLRWAKQGLVWSRRTDVRHHSRAAPNFFELSGKPWAAIASREMDSLRFMPLPQGSGETLRLKNESSPAAPAVAVGARKILCAWRGAGNNDLSVAFHDGLGLTDGAAWAKHNVPGARVCGDSGPAAIYYKGKFVVAWADLGVKPGVPQIRVVIYDDDGKTVGLAPGVISESRSHNSPAMAIVGGELWFAWTGDNQENIYCARISDLRGNPTMAPALGHTSSKGPGLAVRDGCPVLFWRGSDDRVWTSTLLNQTWSEQSFLPIHDFFWSHQDVHAATLGDQVHVGVIQDVQPRVVDSRRSI